LGHQQVTFLDELKSKQLLQFIGVHDGLSGALAASLGFDGLWVSSLGMSATAGLRDRNELTWTECLDIAERVVACTNSPVILDGSEGYGSPSIAALFARRAAKRGVHAICFEDKAFPKSNSFSGGTVLVPSQEFVTKLQRCREVIDRSSFALIGRTEALVAGCGVNEAIDRACLYYEAGADAIIVQSVKSDAGEMELFMSRWPRQCPIIAIPTAYARTPIGKYKSIGLTGIVWANQLLRASISSMREFGKRLRDDTQAPLVEVDLIPISEVLSLFENTDR
jgi:phosphoenolpyruvate phosphomutase